MNTVVTISGGGIIGNYISSRLNANNISTLVIEKNSDVLDLAENVRTVTLNQYSKNLIEKLGVSIPCSEINEILVFDGEGSGKINFHSKDIDEENLSYVFFFFLRGNAFRLPYVWATYRDKMHEKHMHSYGTIF